MRGALAGEPRRLDLAPLYEALARDIPDLNIEGATVAGDRLLLFQRGNGRGAVNAVVALDLDGVLARSLEDGAWTPMRAIEMRRHDLGEVDGVRLCFSDATALHGRPRPLHRGRRRRRGHLPRRRLRGRGCRACSTRAARSPAGSRWSRR